jgi:hypothetical protein
MNQYIFRVEQYTYFSVMAESEAEAYEVMGQEDLSELKPDDMGWEIVDVVLPDDHPYR